MMCQDLKPDLMITCIVCVAEFSYYLLDAVYCSSCINTEVRKQSYHSAGSLDV